MKNKVISAVCFSVLFCFSGVVFGAVKNKAVARENISALEKRTRYLEAEVKSLQNELNLMYPVKKDGSSSQDTRYKTLLEMYAHGPAVVTSPIFNVRRAADDTYEDESALMSQLSPAKEDLVLLDIRRRMNDYAVRNNIEIPKRPIIALSGAIEAQVNYKSKYNKTSKVDVDVNYIELDIIGEIGPWVTSALIIGYDDARPADNTRVSNSKLKLDRGFMTFGNLSRFPVYLTAGQMYLPFGRYSSNMVSTPPTRALGQYKDRMILLGYSKGPFNVQVFGAPGETTGPHDSAASNFFGHTGASIGHDFVSGKFEVDVEASVFGNMAETNDIQKFIFVKRNDETIHSKVMGASGRIKLRYGPCSIFSEYVGATRRFDMRDISFNDQGARPQALNVEAAHEFKIFNKPADINAGYAQTWQALALELPQRTFFAGFDVAFIKNTLFSFEYRHDINYGWNDTATNVTSIDGRHKNSVIGKMAVYF